MKLFDKLKCSGVRKTGCIKMGSGSSKIPVNKGADIRPLRVADFKESPTLYVQAVSQLPIKVEMEKFPFSKCYFSSCKSAGYRIIKPETVSKYVYFVLEGKCLMFKTDGGGVDGYKSIRVLVDTFVKGDCFGVEGCLYQVETDCSIFVCQNAKLLVLPKPVFQEFEVSMKYLDWAIQERNIFAKVDNDRSLFDEILISTLKSTWLFDNWNRNDLKKLCETLTRENLILMQASTYITSSSYDCTSGIIVLLKGEVKLTKEDISATKQVKSHEQTIIIGLEHVVDVSAGVDVMSSTVCYIVCIPISRIKDVLGSEQLLKAKTELVKDYLNLRETIQCGNSTPLALVMALSSRCPFLTKDPVLPLNCLIELILRSFCKLFHKGDIVLPKNDAQNMVVLHGTIESSSGQVKDEKDRTYTQYQTIVRRDRKLPYDWTLSCVSDCCLILYISHENVDLAAKSNL